jgi:hypothetical protein
MSDEQKEREAFVSLHGAKPKLKPNGSFASINVAQKYAFFKAGIKYARTHESKAVTLDEAVTIICTAVFDVMSFPTSEEPIAIAEALASSGYLNLKEGL